jgi:hypothetical protein
MNGIGFVEDDCMGRGIHTFGRDIDIFAAIGILAFKEPGVAPTPLFEFLHGRGIRAIGNEVCLQALPDTPHIHLALEAECFILGVFHGRGVLLSCLACTFHDPEQAEPHRSQDKHDKDDVRGGAAVFTDALISIQRIA